MSKSWSHVPAQIQRNIVLTLSQVLPLPLLQSRRGTTLHRIHPPTSDATALITTSCVLFYFISPFLLLKSSSRSRYHTRRCCTGTTATAYARGMTIQPHPPARKPPRCRRILPEAPTPAAIRGHASYVYFFFVPFLTNFTETLFTRAGSSNPRLSIHNPHHRALPLEPCKSRRCRCLIRGHASKGMFFSFLFFSFLF